MSATLPNPFITGGPVPPEYFIGRESLIKKCYDRMTGPARGGIALYGEEGLGRTSLLYYLRRYIQKEQEQTVDQPDVLVHLYCPDMGKFTPDNFFHSIIETIAETEEDPDLLDQVDALLDKGKINYRIFRRFLRNLKRQNRSLILFLDGFAWIVSHKTSDEKVVGDFLSHLRSLTNDDGFSFVLLVATREPLDSLCGDIVQKRPESHFYNVLSFQPVPPFTDQDIDSLLANALQKADLKFDQKDRELLNRLAGRHPALIQIAAFHLFEERRQGPLTSAVYKSVTKAFEDEASHRFHQFWEVSSVLEKALLIFLILVNLPESIEGRPEFAKEETARIYQTYEAEITNLVQRGLVRTANESYYIFSVVFTRWIAREVDVNAEVALLQQQDFPEKGFLTRIWNIFLKIAPRLTLDLLGQGLVPRAVNPGDLPLVPPNYQNPAKLGRGNFGTVFKAIDIRLQRPVAIKALHHDPAMPIEDGQRRLLKEAQASSNLKHPNIVTIYSVEQVDDQIFLVMEYLEGKTLRQILNEEETISLDRFIHLLAQAASALDYAHGEGVIHRDVKPENLMVTSEDELKLMDFGIAKVSKDEMNKSMTTTQRGELKGSVLYMSPEQVNQISLKGSSDLFSLATVAYEMLCGVSPWQGSSHYEVMKNITELPLKSLVDYNIPQAHILLDDIFKKALAKEAANRHSSCQEFIEALKAATDHLKNRGVLVISRVASSGNTGGEVELRSWLQKFSEKDLYILCYDFPDLKIVYDQLEIVDKTEVVKEIVRIAEETALTDKMLEWIKSSI